MKHLGQLLARRTVIRSAGLGLVSGALANAMTTGRADAAALEGEIWSGEYWAKKGDVPLWMQTFLMPAFTIFS